MIALPAGVQVWLAAGSTDMRKYAPTIVMHFGSLLGCIGLNEFQMDSISVMA